MKMDSLYQWIKFIHVAAGFTFIMAHGTSIAFSFKLKKETDPARVEALFNLSSSMWNTYMISWLVLMVAGIVNGFMGQWWSRGWMWTSLILMLVVTVWMFVLGSRTYHPIRKAFGLPYQAGSKEMPAEEPLPEEERLALISKTRPMELLAVGYGGFIIILWLMIFKPF
jgi:hypothetical protein